MNRRDLQLPEMGMAPSEGVDKGVLNQHGQTERLAEGSRKHCEVEVTPAPQAGVHESAC